MVRYQRVATVSGGSASHGRYARRNPPYVRVFVIPDCFDTNACQRVRGAMDHGAIEPAEILDDGVRLDRRVRVASNIDVDRATLDFVDKALDAQRETIGALFGIVLTAREGAGFLRYGAGSFYRSHRDRGRVETWPAAALRRISVVVFLNSVGDPRDGGFTGGVLRLLDDPPEDIVPRQGCLVAFPAGTLHEVTPVSAGVRDVIVDWFY